MGIHRLSLSLPPHAMSSDRPQSSSSSSSLPSKRLSWMSRYTGLSSRDKDKDVPKRSTLVSPPEGKEVVEYTATPAQPPSTHSPAVGGLPFTRSNSSSALSDSPYASVYGADTPSAPSRRFSTNSLMSKQELDKEASQIIRGAFDRTSSQDTQPPPTSRPSVAFSRKSFTSMMGGLSALSLTRGNTDEKDRGRSQTKGNDKPRSVSAISDKSGDETDSGPASRARSSSPFRRNKRLFLRDPSPSVEALKLSQSDVESDYEDSSSRKAIRPRNAFSQSLETSDDESPDEGEDEGDSEESWSDNDTFDPITMQNTEQNSIVPEPADSDPLDGPDPLGEGVNIVVPPEPYFPSTLNSTGNRNNPRRRKSTKHVSLPLTTSRPEFKRDRCTITLVQGDPANALELNGRRPRRYVVGSDLSEESRYAVEWCVGTVLRDGDEMYALLLAFPIEDAHIVA